MEISAISKKGPIHVNEAFDGNEDFTNTENGNMPVVRTSNGKLSTDIEDGTKL